MDALRIAQELEARRKWNAKAYVFPDAGPLRRELYEKHVAFFDAGASYKERIFIAANRVGKSVAGAFEVACHATGEYPKWWKGRRFDKPVKIWCAGDTGKTTRDIIQNKLMGPVGVYGSGLIPQKNIKRYLQKVGVPDAVEVLYVRHKKGGESMITFKSYDQRREGFQGTEIDVIWLDEEPAQDIYIECLLRTMTTNGVVLTTFTPLIGLSDVVLSFCPGGELKEGEVTGASSKMVVTCDWDSVPHLSAEEKEQMLAAIPPFQRDARSKGIPQLGSGAIYQVPESEIVVDDFPIADDWRRCFGMDVGWNKTAAIWLAYDKENDIVYAYSEHYRGHAEPVVHATSIKARGAWIPGVIDPASRGRSQVDGYSLLDMYVNLGLDLQVANNAVEAGIYEVWERLSTGRLKIFKSLSNLRNEYRIYRRDEKGKIVKKEDHCFVGDTEIITDKGVKKIKDLVGTKGQILSLNGKFKKYQYCRMTRRNAEIVEIEFEDGYKVKCTPDHRFLTINGFKKAIDLLDEDSYVYISQPIRENLWKKLLFTPKLSKSFLENFIIYVVFILCELQIRVKKGFIGLFGSIITICGFLKDIIFTILTKIGLIIKLKIWSLNWVQSMFLSTLKVFQSLFQKMRLKPLQFGMVQKKAKNGIASIMSKINIYCTKKLTDNVPNVEKVTKLPKLMEILFAQIIVNPHIVEQVGLIMKLENVSFVQKNLLLINTIRQKLVREHALVKCKAIQKLPNEDVYCLDVPSNNLFTLKNGAVVHNCLDALRYGIMSGINVSKNKKVDSAEEKLYTYNNFGSINSTNWMQ